jgi:zinc-binding alcohol dehydrogenase/oxidoreductase
MKALVLVGKHQDLSYQEVAKPIAAQGETLVHLKAAALNHRDIWIMGDMYAGIKYPTILGSDGAGETADGRKVLLNPSINWGENPHYQGKDYEILGLPRDGCFAEYTTVPTQNVVDMPEHLSFEQGAALPLAGLTAYRALFTRCQLSAGERVLISGIGGGVALFAMQFAIAAGAEVWVTSSSQEKIDKAVEMGAKGGLLYTQSGWAKEFSKSTGGVDIVIDSAAGDGFSDLIKTCKAGARVCFYGGTRGVINGLSPQIVFFKQISIFGSTMGSNKEFVEMVQFVNLHKIVPVVDAIFKLKDGNQACSKMSAGSQFGKIVLKIS